MLRLFSRRPDLRAEFAALADRGVSPELAARLAEHFAAADARGLTYLNPRLIAGALGLGEREALRLLVSALYAGLVTLHWDVRCPMCGSTDHRAGSLAALRHEHQCPACTAVRPSRLDDEVRVSFSLVERLHPLAAADDPAHRDAVDARLGAMPGHALLLLPEFQQLFPQQRLLPDESLDVTRAALLFTDLAGSTAIYARRGDPRAYHLVRLHFDELFRVADACGGLMVKTIGDAVMAAFQMPAEALRAAMAMQEAIIALNGRASLEGDERLILKVGLHSGPCLSVTLNDRPDYFGGTVNIAARVQGLSTGGDIVLTEAVREDAEARALLGGRELQSGEVRLKGIDEPVLVHRLAV
ncbi:adenylate/guanylate cyclase domain-containing protein [Oscillochloris sp. ZM17-4]|uniref:adenylate/guanylate cyclase domain-containing protein n=1 Tax=Oscillochloris sp. ZM17-4 TaxID=2866714 RepID=UPI001C736BF7|nr:adenylate/guanylate cyclase domain-containing protein [Oscillochloris sp. ZM17-4]MBX0328710.1 adenylate/guanylate cyclase domain-containing protein [Oscillochloris sp. ZM17-4]